jgi:cellulose synthase/poly-beta-1,6-N-acetylglucosamine synthase-like glycosyltransferase
VNDICHIQVHEDSKWAYKGWVLFALIGFLLCVSMLGAIQFENALAWSAGLIYVAYDTWLLSYVAWKTNGLGDEKSHYFESEFQSRNKQSIGVLVPVYNESNGIINTIECLLKQSHLPQKIIIVNDGSTDNTLQKLSKKYGFKCYESQPIGGALSKCYAPKLYASEAFTNLYLFDKENSGKADSLNQVIHHIDCDVVVTVDADTLLDRHAINEAHNAFKQNPALIAACGVLKPVTNGNIVSRLFGFFQYFEYLRAYLSRAAWSHSNALLLVSGAFSIYKKSALVAVGGYDDTSLVEDYELIHRMHQYASENNLDWRIDVIEKACATTDAPTTISAFISQRKRWFTGFLRTQFKYRHMIGVARYKNVGQFMLPIKTVDTLQPMFGLVALILLWHAVISGANVSVFILTVIGIKLIIDYCFHIWSLHKYHSWLGLSVPRDLWWKATICCLTDPFVFQPLRHLSALIGWMSIFKGNVSWEPVRIKQKTPIKINN